MNPSGIQPLYLVTALVGIGGTMFTVYSRYPHLSPYLFLCSLLALVLRVRRVHRDLQEDVQDAIDFKRLRAYDIGSRGERVKDQLRGHDVVVDAVVAGLRRSLSLAGPGRTLGAFMLVGPTGTGKTYLAELFAKELYPDSQPLILRMNQYKQPEDVYTLIGPPPGQPGYEVGGALTRPVLENPYRVILLDELDKCHKDVRDCLYNVLDAGECREKSSGRLVHFNACVFFATSNAGVEQLRALKSEPLPESARMGRMRDVLTDKAGFEKPLLARFDDVYFLDTLEPIHVAEVACLRLAAQWKQYGIDVRYAEPELILEAMRQNEDFREYGVRQLYRLIQELTDESIQSARKLGHTKVKLGIDPDTRKLKVTAA